MDQLPEKEAALWNNGLGLVMAIAITIALFVFAEPYLEAFSAWLAHVGGWLILASTLPVLFMALTVFVGLARFVASAFIPRS